jgi:glycosyltransferase involved in cell wall biosynthesis
LIYEGVACLLVNSEGEGFGLPLIEAAKYGLPILARDIAVFREVGQSTATYFSAKNYLGLKVALSDWMKNNANKTYPPFSQLIVSTWDECSRKIKIFLRNDDLHN